jgi:CubicO group peptidase (beta-lactamase class C family)
MVTRRWDPTHSRPAWSAPWNTAQRAMVTSTTPGLAVALVRHGQVVWGAGYGVADRTTRQPVTAATRFAVRPTPKPP